MGTIFAIPEGARLRVLTVSGKVRVTGEDRIDIDIEPAERNIETLEDGHILETRSRSKDLHLHVPTWLNVSVGTISGDVNLEGQVGSVKINTVSGKVTIDRANGDADIRSISGSISVDECGGRCRANSKTGKIDLGHVAGAIKAHTMSGNIGLGTAGADEVDVKTISGTVEVLVDEGRAPRLRFRTITGRTRCDCAQGSDFEIKASTISGSVEVRER
ncbi:MAG: DUF4097 family beta strand repeat-containing protein [Dehalococcoidia bacterium]